MKITILDESHSTAPFIKKSFKDLGHVVQGPAQATTPDGIPIVEPGQDHILIIHRKSTDPMVLKFCQTLQQGGKGAMPYILQVLPAVSTLDDVRDALIAGVDDFLIEPLDGIQIEKRLRRAIQLSEARKRIDLHQTRIVETLKLSALGEMAGGICHELNNPLSIISGTSQGLAGNDTSTPIDHAHLARAVARIDRGVARLTNSVQGISLIGADRDENEAREAQLHKIVENTLLFSKTRLQNKDIQIRSKAHTGDTKILCRPHEIALVLVCLFNNVREAVGDTPHSWVEVKLEDHLDRYEVSVIDSGPGVPPQIRDKIFDPFFTTRAQGKGKGLGLTIALQIIQAHGGKLYLDISAENTRFVFRLPKPKVSN